MSDERTGSQQTISKQMLEKVKLLQQEKQENGTSNTQTVRERNPVDRKAVPSVYG